MKRKIIKQGNGSYTMTLPVEWVRKNQMNDDTYISVDEIDNKILISPESGYNSQKEIDIRLETNSDSIIRTLVAGLYRIGYDKIRITLKDAEKKPIYDVVSSLFGFEVTEDKGNEIIISNISIGNEEKIDSIIRRLFLSIQESIKKILSFFNEPKKRALTVSEDFIIVRDNHLRLRDLCLRLINKENSYNNKSYETYSLVLFLEKLASAFRRAAKYIAENESFFLRTDNKIYFAYFNRCSQIFNRLYHSYFKKEKIVPFGIREECSAMLNDIMNLSIKRMTKHDLYIVSSLRFIIESLHAVNSRTMSLIVC